MLLVCCVPGYQGWVSCSSPVRTSSGRAAWASQSRRDKSPFGCTAMCLWAARSPQTCRAFLYTASDNKDALSTLFLECCLTCFHSGWLVCLVLQDTVALFYPSCPGTWGQPCGAVKCLEGNAEYKCIHALPLKLTDLMAKPIPQCQFEMKGKTPGCCEGL